MSSETLRRISRPIRNNNPLNIRHSTSPWKGKAPMQTDVDFVQFIDPHHGIRAATLNLLTYYRKHKLSTVPEIVQRWAPPEDDNDTASYISSVIGDLGITADTKLDLEEPEIMVRLVTAMMKIECGVVPYPEEQIRIAVHAAYGGGIVSPVPPPISVVPVPAPYHPPATLPGQERPVPPLVNQPAATPTRKVQAIPIGGLVGVPVAWVAKVLWDRLMPDQPMPVEVAMAIAGFIATVGAYLAAYLTRNRATLPPPPQPYDQGHYY